MISLSEEMEKPSRGAVNFMEPQRDIVVSNHLSVGAKWFNEARLGMFVHFGLYSSHGLGEWHMYFDRVPAAQYNKLADNFNPEAFDAEEIVGLAKRAGAGYVVLGARHHEGYCLWDTATTTFNSVKGVPKRDFIREFTDACRAAGLRVGIYYSIMSWQWPAIHRGPVKDPEGWAGMVAETHTQIRELMSQYGQIDYLWYDGCVVPGMGDPSIRVHYWKSAQLNAMVRELQPGILINDRSGLPEDVTTPEQHLTPGPRGRLWECCQTIGTSWAWRHDDTDLKDSTTLIDQLIFCARFGGNFLLNIGPRGDGSLDPEQVVRMEEIGRWMEANGESIRGSERTPYTEALHVLGEATSRANRIYFHLGAWPDAPHRAAGIHARILSACILGEEDALRFEQRSDGTVSIFGLPVWNQIVTPRVLELVLDEAAPTSSPPALLYEKDTGRHLPAEAPLHSIDEWEMEREQTIEFYAEAPGTYDLEFCVVAQEAMVLQTFIDGEPAGEQNVPCGEYPVTLRISNLQLDQGTHRLELLSLRALFACYMWRLQPIWIPVPATSWRVIGPFPTDFHPQSSVSEVKKAMGMVFPPEEEFLPAGSYEGAEGKMVRWQPSELEGDTVNFACVCGTESFGVCYARMIVVSPVARALDFLLACDWWANVFVNGRKVESARDPASQAEDGAAFSDWKPMPARIHLVAGPNVFLVKCHPGSTDNWFTLLYNNPGDITLLA
ncbi:MAG: hypothetical protein E6Q40_02790 [Cupriavidus sp.]|nr:MAG: hypothetical protein E6Q40_02790 [Cupriavidus sp.]